jgi:surface antigen
MSVFARNTMSDYLAIQPGHTPSWARPRRRLGRIVRSHPGIWAKTMVALGIWTALVASVQYVTTPHTYNSFSASMSSPFSLAAAPATATKALPATELPGGPTGMLLPPGAMAPQGTFANTYVRGQCTWYVAGRRQVPSSWGNARSWYYHASAEGWKVGTVPAIAAIAWTPAGTYGHVALVEQISPDGQQVFVSEMNFKGPFVRSTRWVNASAFKYIY